MSPPLSVGEEALFQSDLTLLSSASAVLKNCAGYASAGGHLSRVVRRWIKSLHVSDSGSSPATSNISSQTPGSLTGQMDPSAFAQHQMGLPNVGLDTPSNDPAAGFNSQEMDLSMPNWLDFEGDILSMGGFKEWNWGLGDPNALASELRGGAAPADYSHENAE
jgi:hypothetical protein